MLRNLPAPLVSLYRDLKKIEANMLIPEFKALALLQCEHSQINASENHARAVKVFADMFVEINRLKKEIANKFLKFKKSKQEWMQNVTRIKNETADNNVIAFLNVLEQRMQSLKGERDVIWIKQLEADMLQDASQQCPGVIFQKPVQPIKKVSEKKLMISQMLAAVGLAVSIALMTVNPVITAVLTTLFFASLFCIAIGRFFTDKVRQPAIVPPIPAVKVEISTPPTESPHLRVSSQPILIPAREIPRRSPRLWEQSLFSPTSRSLGSPVKHIDTIFMPASLQL